jgi:aminoglycoside phosphotransferase (APT) family kinase protein
LPWIGPLLPTAVPEIVGLGEPGFGYAERWSVLRWVEGQIPAVPGPGAQVDPSLEVLGLDLAAVVTALGEIDVLSDALAEAPQV